MSEAIYSVNVFHNGEFLFKSEESTCKKTASNFLNECNKMDVSKLEFKMFVSKQCVQESFKEECSTYYKGWTVEDYKQGILLRPYYDSDWDVDYSTIDKKRVTCEQTLDDINELELMGVWSETHFACTIKRIS